MLAVLPLLLLALHHHEQLVLGFLGRVEHGDIDGVGLLLVRRADADPVLGAGLNLALGVPVVLDQATGEDLDGFNFFGCCSNLGSADVVGDELAPLGGPLSEEPSCTAATVRLVVFFIVSPVSCPVSASSDNY